MSPDFGLQNDSLDQPILAKDQGLEAADQAAETTNSADHSIESRI